jgi:hypothetical protein
VSLSAAHGSGVTDDDFRVIAESIPHIVWPAAPDGLAVA